MKKSVFVFVLMSLSGFAVAQDIAELSTCMECHNDPELFGEVGEEEVLMFIEPERFQQSVHGDMACVDCHEDIEEAFHDADLQPVDCGICHEDQAEELLESVHLPSDRNACASCHGNSHSIVPRDHSDSLLSSRAIRDQCLSCHLSSNEESAVFIHSTTGSLHLNRTDADGEVVNCAQCHGSHQIAAMDDPRSLLHPAHAHNTCGECHTEAKRQFENSIHGQTLARGMDDAATCTHCHSEHSYEESIVTESRLWIHNTCGQCHFDDALMNRHGVSVNGFEQLVSTAVHAEQVRAGNPNAPVCSDCHGYHEILPLNDPQSNVFFQNVANTCGRCHEKEKEQYEISVHGVSSARGHKDAPVCTDCHGEHSILRTEDEDAPVHQLNIAKSTCARCHESVVLNRKYDIGFGKVESYFDSYHGLAVKWGSQRAANCGSCHGNHMILPSTDPRSTISPARLAETCGQCHQGISQNVLLSPIHTASGFESNSLASWIQRIYIVLIIAVISGMLLHNAVIYFSIVRAKQKRNTRIPTYTRFNGFEIISHLILTISFILLVVTGFALVFTDSWWVGLLNGFGVTEEIRAWLHRVAGVALIAVSIAYGLYMLFTRRGRSELYHFSPSWEDVKQACQYTGYYLGFYKSMPKFGRYDYTEKLEFWALVWGVIIMAVTGLILWFPVWTLDYLPKWVIDIAEIVHYYEAILAALAILVWHFFFVIYHPDEYPMNTAWLDGKMTLEELKHRHPKEYEEWEQQMGSEKKPISNENIPE